MHKYIKDWKIFREKYFHRKSDYIDQSGFSLLLGKIKQSILNEEDMFIVIVGDKGSGKSNFAVTLSTRCKESNLLAFDIHNNLHSKALPFLQQVREAKRTALIFDEAGKEFDRQTWMKIESKAIRYMLQSQRVRQNMIIMTAPDMTFLSKASPKLLRWGIECEKNRDSNTYNAIVKLVKVDHFTGDFQFWRFMTIHGIPKAYDEDWESYKEQEEGMKDLIMDESIEDIEYSQIRKEYRRIDIKNKLNNLKNPTSTLTPEQIEDEKILKALGF